MTAKIALITGGNKGIGFEIARGLGEAGHIVLLGARSAERGETAAARLRERGADVRFLQLDVTDEAAIAAAVEHIETEHGRLDILVNNAGVAMVPGVSLNTSEYTADAARQTFELNVVAVLAVTNALMPLLKRSAAARIVNVSSEVGSNEVALDQSGPLWGLQGGAYAASKAALNRLTVSYAKEFWDTTMRFNVVTPGYCATDFNNNTGYRSAAEGAAIAIATALRGEDSPNAAFLSDEPEYLTTAAGTVPW